MLLKIFLPPIFNKAFNQKILSINILKKDNFFSNMKKIVLKDKHLLIELFLSLKIVSIFERLALIKIAPYNKYH